MCGTHALLSSGLTSYVPSYLRTCKYLFIADACIPTIFGCNSATWGSKLGMRQMILARYTFGWDFLRDIGLNIVSLYQKRYYGIILPCILNLASVIGFSVSNCILGGQTLASVTNGNLSWTYVINYQLSQDICWKTVVRRVGIVVFTIVSVLVSFFGYRFLNW